MNGRRDFGIAMAEHNDSRRQIQEANYTAYTVMQMLAVLGILAVIYDDTMLLPAVIFGAATVIGIWNWRTR
jgi:protein-S-isoprenylcysteine O-methyltransferase Ste14